MIAGDHDNADPGASAFRQRLRYVAAQWISQADQTEQLELELAW